MNVRHLPACMRQHRDLTMSRCAGAIYTKEGSGELHQLAGGACLVRSARLMCSMLTQCFDAILITLLKRLLIKVPSIRPGFTLISAMIHAGMWLRTPMSCASCSAERSGQGPEQAPLSLLLAVRLCRALFSPSTACWPALPSPLTVFHILLHACTSCHQPTCTANLRHRQLKHDALESAWRLPE